MKESTFYAILDRKGRVVFNLINSEKVMLYKNKRDAVEMLYPDYEETIQKVKIIAV